LVAMREFMSVYERLRPFYSEAIYTSIKAFDDLCWQCLGRHQPFILVSSTENVSEDRVVEFISQINLKKEEIEISLENIAGQLRKRVLEWEMTSN